MENTNIKLNKFYQLISENQNPYSDDFSEAFSLIVDAKEKKEISELEFNFLAKILLTRTIKEESKDVMRWNSVTKKSNNTTSLFINVSNNEKKYV